jgi:hypothetical protein
MSKAGKDAWFHVRFRAPVAVDRLRMVFQGGFAALEVRVEHRAKKSDVWSLGAVCGMDDANLAQDVALAVGSCTELRLVFLRTADFYGRVALYTLDAFGRVLGAADGDEGRLGEDS